MTFISILMPLYNGVEYIGDSVISVISQKYEKWELLIGVNGHPPNSEIYKTAKIYEKIDSRIKVYDFHNIKGKANTLNKMIGLCKYDYVALLDVDDIWHEMKLEVQHNLLNYGFDVVGTNCLYFGDRGGVPDIPLMDITEFNFFMLNPIINSSVIIRKSLCHWHSNFDGVEDYDLWLKLRKQNCRFFNCPELLVKHRIHESSSFNSKGNGNKVPELLSQYI